jgi:hypothetical protein
VRIPKWEHQQIDWNEHVTKRLHENRFHCEYRMSLEDFNQLLELLRPSITVNVVKSNASSGLYSSNQHIYPELILAMVKGNQQTKRLTNIYFHNSALELR